MRWVIGDVHGCFFELIKLLREIQFRPSRDTVVFLGDFVDRGPNSKEVVNFVREGHMNGYFKVIRGNHDDEWLKAYQTGLLHMLSERYPETWHSFDGREVIREYVEWVDTLPTYIETEHILLVHGGMEPDRHFREQSPETLMWTRNTTEIPQEFRDGKIVIHGHTPTPYPIVMQDRINIDTGCVFGGRLTALSIDELERGKIVWHSVDGRKVQNAVS